MDEERQQQQKCKQVMIALSAQQPPNSAKRPHSHPLPARRISKAIDVATARAASAGTGDIQCGNPSCRAVLPHGSPFCRRCSCCICKRHDENKDPSLWLVCGDNGLSDNVAGCGLSCHLQCALADQNVVDSGYRCSGCSGVTSLLGSVKKQLLQAQAARRVDTLYQRLDLATRLMNGSQTFSQGAELLRTALEKLLADIGPQSAASARNLVTRVSSGPQVLELISRALLSMGEVRPEYNLQVISSSPTSVLLAVIEKQGGSNQILGYKIWHRKLRGVYCTVPTMTVEASGDALLTNLLPSMGYMFKAVAFSSKGDEGSCECKGSTLKQEVEVQRVLSPKASVSQEGQRSLKDVANISSPKHESLRTNALGVNATFHSSEESGSSLSMEDRIMAQSKGLPAVTIDAQVNLSEESRTDISQNGQEERVIDLQTSIDLTVDLTCLDPQRTGIETDSCMESPNLRHVEKVQTPAPRSTVNNERGNKERASPKKRPAAKPKPVKEVINELEAMNNNLNFILAGPRAAFLDSRSTTAAPPPPAAPAAPVAPTSTEAAAVAAPSSKKDLEVKQVVPKKRCAEEAFDSKKWEMKWDACESKKWTERMFEQCAKMVRWLECQGHIKSEFRKQFFTWLGVKASDEQRRVVNIFIQTMMGDPAALASQLVDSFDEVIQASRSNLDIDWL